MSKKKENQRSYLQAFIPEDTKSYKAAKLKWCGYNKRQTIDTGALSMEKNISSAEAPYLVPSEKMIPYFIKDGAPISYVEPIDMFGFDDFLLVVYKDDEKIKLDYIKCGKNASDFTVYTGVLKEFADASDKVKRSVVQFNVYDAPTDPVDGKYVKKLLIFPDKKSLTLPTTLPSDYDGEEITSELDAVSDKSKLYIRAGDNTCYYWEKNGNGYRFVNALRLPLKSMDVEVKSYHSEVLDEATGTYPPPDTASHNYYYKNTYDPEGSTEGENIYRWVDDPTDSSKSGWKVSIPPSFPPLQYAAVHLSRLFGVSEDRVYASGFNDYANWNLDTADEYNESNAWCSPAQSNTKADGDFTGIAVFQNHVVCFKEDFMHELYNNKNPFRIQDIYPEGAINNKTIQDVGGNLIFTSRDGVKVYTGGDPRHLSYAMNIGEIKDAISGTDGRNYYLYYVDKDDMPRILVFDTLYSEWSEREVPNLSGDFPPDVIAFAHNSKGMFLLTDGAVDEQRKILKLDSGQYDHDWSFETDLMTNQTVDIKHLKKIQMFMDCDKADVRIYALYDNEVFSPESSHLLYVGEKLQGKKTIRVKPRMSAHYGVKFHVEGTGYIRLYELEVVTQAGGGLYVSDTN